MFHPGTLPHGVSWLRSGNRYSVIILCNDAELEDGTVLHIPKPEVPMDAWERMLELQEAAMAASRQQEAAAAAAAAAPVVPVSPTTDAAL